MSAPAPAREKESAGASHWCGMIWPLALFGLLAIAPLLGLAGVQAYWISLLTRVMIFAIAALSLDLLLGAGGLVSFGHAAYLAIGAYATGILIAEGHGETLIVLPAAMLACGVFAALTSAISLRTRGVAFIMITLAFGQMVYFIAQSLYAWGGDDGLVLSERATFAGFAVFKNKIAFFYIVLALLAACYVFLRSLLASRFGRVLRAARENSDRLALQGYDIQRVRLAACVIAGMIGGLAGFLLANHTEFVSPAFAAWQRSGELLFMVILGGAGTLHGAIIGALVFMLSEEVLSGWTQNWKIIFGPLVVLFVIFTRGGLVGIINKIAGARNV